MSLESGHPVEWMEEENYLFRLKNFKDDLRNWIKTDGKSKKNIFAYGAVFAKYFADFWKIDVYYLYSFYVEFVN